MEIGKISERTLRRSVLRHIHKNRDEIKNGAGVGADCAIFAFPQSGFFAVCVQAGSVYGEEGTPGGGGIPRSASVPGGTARLIQRAANGVACGGALPVAALLTVTLPETAREAQLQAVMQEAAAACSSLNMELAGGHTAVSASVLVPQLSVTAFGAVPEGEPWQPSAPEPGQDVVMSKWTGLMGTARIAEYKKERLLTRYPAHLVETAASFGQYHSVLPEAAAAVSQGVCAMHDVSGGGIFGALWELAERAGTGISVDLKKIPVKQETIEICEFFGANPYELDGGGSLLMTAGDGAALVKALAQRQIYARVIGKITKGHDKVVINDGAPRYLERPRFDAIRRIPGMEP